MSGWIGIDITGIETLKQRLARLPKEAKDAAVETADAYLLQKLRTYPPKSGGKFKWKSDKQRKAVMAKLREQGGPPYQRTQELRTGWKTEGKGFQQIIANEVPYADFVMGDNQQPGFPGRGWKKAGEILANNARRVLDKFEEGVRKAIKKVGL